MKCEYKLSENDLPDSRVLWIAECGYQYALIMGYNPDYNHDNYGKLILPKGKCGGCGKEITICNGTGKEPETECKPDSCDKCKFYFDCRKGSIANAYGGLECAGKWNKKQSTSDEIRDKSCETCGNKCNSFSGCIGWTTKKTTPHEEPKFDSDEVREAFEKDFPIPDYISWRTGVYTPSFMKFKTGRYQQISGKDCEGHGVFYDSGYSERVMSDLNIYTTAQKKAQSEIEELKEIIAIQKEDLENTRILVEDYKLKYSLLQIVSQNLNNQNDRYVHRIKELEQQNEKLIDDYGFSNKRVEDQEDKLSNLERKMDDMKAISPDHVSYLKEMSRLQQQVETITEKYSSLTDKYCNLVEQNIEMKNQKRYMIGEIENAVNEFSSEDALNVIGELIGKWNQKE